MTSADEMNVRVRAATAADQSFLYKLNREAYEPHVLLLEMMILPELQGCGSGLTTNHPNSMLSASEAPGIEKILRTRKSRS